MRFSLAQALKTPASVDAKTSTFNEWYASKLEPQRESILADADQRSRSLFKEYDTNMYTPTGTLEKYLAYSEELDDAVTSGDLVECVRLLNETEFENIMR